MTQRVFVIAMACPLAIAGVQAQQPNPATSPVAGTAAISGVVVDGTTKQPLAEAIVQLSGSGRGGAAQPRMMTDSKGRFLFRNLTPSPVYTVSATKAGYVTMPARTGETLDRSPVADGEWISDLVVPLWRLSSISGSIIDERGEPIVGIPVAVLARVPAAGTMHLASVATAKTDDRGMYRISGLRAGAYVVMVPSVQAAVPATTSPELLSGRATGPAPDPANAGIEIAPNAAGINVGNSRLVVGNYATPPPLNGRPQAYPMLFHPGLRSPARAPSIDLGYGDERSGVDFSLQPVPAASVSGRVTGPPGSWAGLVLRLLVEGGEELGLGHEQATALVANDGSFSFLSVPTGTYTLEAKRAFGVLTLAAPGAQANSNTVGLISPGASVTQVSSSPPGASVMVRQSTAEERYWARQRVDVSPEGASSVTVALRPAVSVSGRVVFDGPAREVFLYALVVEPADGHASKGVSRIPPPGVGPAPTGGPDEFSFSGLTDGQYFLRYNMPGTTTAIAKSILANGVDYLDRPFDATGGDLTNVVVTVTDKLATLTGTVRDRRGGTVADAAVIAFPADSSLWTRYGFSPPRIKSTLVSKQGTYRIQALPQGEYLVVAVNASQRDAWQDSRFFPAAAGQAARTSVDWGATQTVNVTVTDVTLR